MTDEGAGLSPADFGAAFKGFLEQSVGQAPREEPFFVQRLQEHFGTNPRDLPVVSHEFAAHDHPNVQRALDSYVDSRDVELLGITSSMKRFNGVGLADLVARQGGGLYGDASPTAGPVEYVDIELGHDTLTCISSGLALIRRDDERLALLISQSELRGRSGGVAVEVMAPDKTRAESVLAELRVRVREKNVYRGSVISLEREQFGPIRVRFHSLPDVARDEIILPSGVLERVERQTLGFTQHIDALRHAGQHVKRGLLLHGPPGTGKTLTAKYVAKRMHDRTVVLLTGPGMGLIEPACSMARVLQPSTIIIEDVDLIAEERTHDHDGSTALLFELLNQMDGMEEDADVVFLLTTNRPDLLEPALAARPGRVDLAVEIPLPDADSRRRLFELYGRGLDLEVDELDRYIERTQNVSAAFIRELVRKAALAAADESGDGLVIRNRHLDDALQELLFEGGELTRSLLGGHGPQRA